MKLTYSIDEIVAHAASIMPELDERGRAIARTWVTMAMRDFRYQPNKIGDVEIEFDDTIKGWIFPNDMLKLIEFYVLSEEGNPVKTRILRTGEEIDPEISFGKTNENQDFAGTRLNIAREYQVFLGDHAMLISPDFVDDIEFSRPARMKYYSLSDADDATLDIAIHEQFLTPVVTYIRYMNSIREGQDMRAQEMLRIQALNEAARAKARLKSVSKQEAKKIGRDWLTMIPNFNN